MKFQKFNPPCDEIDVALFNNLQIPKYRTVDVVGIKELDVNSINFKNSNGQIINLARSTGTDKENVSQLQESLVNEGWDLKIWYFSLKFLSPVLVGVVFVAAVFFGVT